MIYKFIAKELGDLKHISSEINTILSSHKESNVILFEGGMGAGKTTLIRALCDDRGVNDSVTSPTFAIVNEYEDRDQNAIYHFDFYRIESIREVYDLGYETYFESGSLCLIEWPERIASILEEEDLTSGRLSIDVDDNDYRVITLTI